MIISHRFRFIFIKTAKTAGTSIEIALSRYCGANDIITPITPDCEKIRRGLGYRGPQNHLAPLREHCPGELLKWMRKGKRKPRFYNHMPAADVKALVGPEVWGSYYKFCFERNPWDRLISLYYWACRAEPRPTISEFLESQQTPSLSRRGLDLYTIDGKVAVDKVCRFENLAEELEQIRSQLGIPDKLEVPRAKAGHRMDKRCYREILSDAERERIGSMCAREIELWGYRF